MMSVFFVYDLFCLFFFNDTATPEIYTLSLHDALPISRLSEPRNYSASGGPGRLTVLCAELPCSTDDPTWSLDDEALGRLVRDALERAGLPVRAPVKEVLTRRLPNAYPIYRRGYKEYFDCLDEQMDGMAGLVTFGRQGLFAHD